MLATAVAASWNCARIGAAGALADPAGTLPGCEPACQSRASELAAAVAPAGTLPVASQRAQWHDPSLRAAAGALSAGVRLPLARRAVVVWQPAEHETGSAARPRPGVLPAVEPAFVGAAALIRPVARQLRAHAGAPLSEPQASLSVPVTLALVVALPVALTVAVVRPVARWQHSPAPLSDSQRHCQRRTRRLGTELPADGVTSGAGGSR